MKTRKLLFTKSLKAIFFLAVWCVCSLTAQAQSGDFGEGNALHWTFNSGTLTISGTGAMDDYTNSNQIPWDSYTNSITAVTIDNGVTRIGNLAFFGCSNLNSATISGSVESIGNNAFTGCSNLTNITIPEGVTDIGYHAFSNCSSLTTVNIPASVTYIGGGVFAGCIGLTAITVEPANINYSSDGGLLFNKTKTELIQYPAGKTGAYAIPDGVTSIAAYAFAYCSNLTAVTISNSVMNIGSFAFDNCSSLTSVNIPANVTNIDGGIFRGCSSLTDITVAGGNTSYSSESGVLFDANKIVLVTCPAGKTGAYVIPDGVTTIMTDAFSNCNNLTSVTFPSNATNIGRFAFSPCNGLTSITIPANMTTIEEYAFHACGNLASVTSLADTPPTLGANVFYGIASGATLTVPAGSVSAYQGSTWGSYFSSINGNSTTQTWDCGPSGSSSVTATLAGGTLTVSGAGPMDNYAYNTAPWSSHRNSITAVIIENNVTSIGNWAFDLCQNLTSVTIPDGVVTIGEESFASCHSLTSITIPGSVTNIGNDAFGDCINLTSVTSLAVTPPTLAGQNPFLGIGAPADRVLTFPSGSGSAYAASAWGHNFPIDISETWNCGPGGIATAVATLTGNTLLGGAAMTVTGTGAMNNYSSSSGNILPWDNYTSYVTSIVIGEGITTAGDSAFACCFNLASLTLPSTLTSIGYYSFYNCSSLTSVAFPPSLISIGAGAFGGCTGLTSLTLPSSLASIGEYAFFSCTGLMSVTLPPSLTSIGGRAFWQCTGLAFVTSLAATPPVLGTDAFAGIPADANLHISAVFASAYLSSAWGSYFSLFAVQPSYLQTGNPASSLTAGANTGYYFLRVDSIGGHTGINSGMPHVFGEGVVLFAGKDASGRSALFIDTLSQAAKRHPAYLATSNDAEIYASASWKVAVTSDVGGGNHTFDFTNERQQRLLSVNASEAGQEARIPGDDLGGWHFSDGISSLQTCRPLYTYTSPDRVIVLVADPVNPLGTVKVKDVAVTDLYSISGINGLLYFTLVERSLSISADLLYFAAGGGSRSLNIVSNGQWIVTGASGGALPSWITVSPSSGTGNRTLGIAATANPATSSRTAVIEIYDGCTDCGTGAPLLGTVTVTQDAATSTPAPALSVSPASLDFAAAGGALSIAVSSGTSWTVSSSASWATISAASGSGNGSVTVTASAHSGTTSRTATVTVSGGGLTRTVDVTQAEAPAPPSLEVATASLHFETAGGTQHVGVTANRDWTAGGDASWLTVTKSGVTLGVTAAPNTGYARTGSVTVTAGGITQTVTVAQDAAQQIIAEPAPPEDGHGAIEIALEIPVTEQFRITFTVTLPAGFVLDQQATSLVSELLNSYRLSITPNGQGGWLFEITPATSLRSDDGTAYRQIVNIAYTVPDNVKNGSYEVKLQKMTLTMNSGEVVMRDEISVPVRVGGIAGSADIETAEILYRNGILSVATPVSEQIAVYSTGGVPVYLARKAEGIATFDLNGLPKGVYIVRGSSGWVRKIAF